MTLAKKIQMKAGSPITLLQFVSGLIMSLLILIVPLALKYTDHMREEAIEKKGMQDKIDALNDWKLKSEAMNLARIGIRDAQLKVFDERIDENTSDIKLLKATKKDK